DARAATGVRDKAELRRQNPFGAAALESPADEFFVDVRAVNLCSVDVGDAQVERAMDRANRFLVAPGSDVVVPRHRHRAESDARDVEAANRDVLHDYVL